MIAQTIGKEITKALKSRDEVRLSTLRLLSSAINYERIAKQHDLSEKEEWEVVRREIRRRREAIDAYLKAGASEKARKEEEELKILEEFLPGELSEEEISKIIDEVISSKHFDGLKDFGKVMGEVMGRVSGRAEGKKVSELVNLKLKSIAEDKK